MFVGVEIYCAPTADSRDVWQASMTHIAVEGGCFVLSANQFCRRKDYPPPPEYVFSGKEEDLTPDSVVCAGGSVIISPTGTVLAGPNFDGEALISADLGMLPLSSANKFLNINFDFWNTGWHLFICLVKSNLQIENKCFQKHRSKYCFEKYIKNWMESLATNTRRLCFQCCSLMLCNWGLFQATFIWYSDNFHIVLPESNPSCLIGWILLSIKKYISPWCTVHQPLYVVIVLEKTPWTKWNVVLTLN